MPQAHSLCLLTPRAACTCCLLPACLRLQACQPRWTLGLPVRFLNPEEDV
jgi:hypothetical protein